MLYPLSYRSVRPILSLVRAEVKGGRRTGRLGKSPTGKGSRPPQGSTGAPGSVGTSVPMETFISSVRFGSIRQRPSFSRCITR